MLKINHKAHGAMRLFFRTVLSQTPSVQVITRCKDWFSKPNYIQDNTEIDALFKYVYDEI
jgi:hypothetical protein